MIIISRMSDLFEQQDKAAEPPRSNVPEFSVSELAFSLKRTLEENYSRVRVRGELSRITIPKSGHMYTDLKDDKSVINAICWKGQLSKLSVKPEEGIEVICVGRITTYPARSNYQLIIESMELAGEGALLKLLEERKKKLAAEGLFAEERKQQLPFLPQKIGVITSPTGAVIRDILHRLRDRFPRHVMLWPVKVQGEKAAEEIEAAINGFNNLPQDQKPDILIVARGGGSLEDLMPFNEENLVRAAANSKIPIISAVGHETDTTLIDYAADLRAPTPTGAAEMAVPVRINLAAQIADNDQRLMNSIGRFITTKRQHLETLSAKLGDPAHLLEIKTQRLDRANDQLENRFQRIIAQKKQDFTTHSARLAIPKTVVERAKTKLERQGEKFAEAAVRLFDNRNTKLQQLSEKLELLSFENVLKRGYVVVRDQNNAPVTNANALKCDQIIDLQFQNNEKVGAIVKNGLKKPKTASKNKKTDPKDQQSLF